MEEEAPKRLKNPTLEDVAALANVSTSTVSRTLNTPGKVKESIQLKIHDAIHTLGYIPHGAARALATRRTRTIGAVVPTIDNTVFATAIQHLQQALTTEGFNLLLANSAYSLDEELREVQNLIARGIDGLVLVGEQHHPALYSALERHRLAHVNLWIYNSQSAHSCIGFDHLRAGQILGEHLVGLKHTKFGFISGIQQNNDRAAQRLRGVLNYLQSQDITIEPDCIIDCRYSVEHGRQALHQLLKDHPEITAVLCGNDTLALGALWAAREKNLSVPDQLSVTGFDNMDMTPALLPALTTINAPARQMGVTAARYLINQLQSDTMSLERIELEADLVVRESTAIAPSMGV